MHAKAIVLTAPGGLVKYPIGKGGIVLNQLDLTAKEPVANKEKKRGIFASILPNIGCSFESK